MVVHHYSVYIVHVCIFSDDKFYKINMAVAIVKHFLEILYNKLSEEFNSLASVIEADVSFCIEENHRCSGFGYGQYVCIN